MQKLKKSYVLLLGIFLFNSCAGLPVSPKLELCSHDEVNASAECYDSQTQEYRSIPMEETDRYMMVSPDDWGTILLYIEKLKQRLRRSKFKSKKQAARELNKITDVSELLTSENNK